MEVVIPRPTMDFPQLSAPSTPKRFSEFYSYFSAPTSPTRVSEFYRHFEDFSRTNSRSSSSSAAVPFQWEEKPGTPKPSKLEDDFAFDLGADSERASRTAEELFDGGKIKPLKLPPAFQFTEDEEAMNPKSPLLSPRSPRSPKEIIRQVFSPRKRKDPDPFQVAADNARKKAEEERGRGRAPAMASSNSRRATRSLSPYRVSVYPWDEEEKQHENNTKPSSPKSKTSFSNASSSSKSSKRWRLTDFLLFRSKSEGHATEKSFFPKYPSFFRKHEDVKNASFRSNDSSVSSHGPRRKGPLSAHELYYTTNKAAREDLKRKTSLPYKQGIWGRLALPNGFASFRR